MLSRYLRFLVHRRMRAACAEACVVIICAVVVATAFQTVCSAAGEITLDSLTYEGLIERILVESSSATAARQDYELSLLRNANSAKLWDPEVSLSGTLERYDVIKDSHDRSVTLSVKNQTQTLGGTVTVEAGSVYDPGIENLNLRNQLSVTFNRSLTTGGIEASLVELRETLAALQADKTYADQMSDLLIKGITGLSTALKERNDLIVSAVRLELAAFGKAVADEKYSHGMISAAALATAQDDVRNASKTYFDRLTAYRDRLWELSRSTGLAEITDRGLDADVSSARLVVSEFLRSAAFGNGQSMAAAAVAEGLLEALHRLVLLPDATIRDMDARYEELAGELIGEEGIKQLPAMRITDLGLEIERLTLEKNEKDLGWKLNAAVGASWADFASRPAGGMERASNPSASVTVSFSKQLLGSSVAETTRELQVKRSRLEDEAKAALPSFARQLSNLARTVEDKEYAQEAAQQSLGESRELWKLTVSNYDAGMATNADVVSAAVSLLQAESAMRSSQIESLVAKLRYINALGQSPMTGRMGDE